MENLNYLNFFLNLIITRSVNQSFWNFSCMLICKLKLTVRVKHNEQVCILKNNVLIFKLPMMFTRKD